MLWMAEGHYSCRRCRVKVSALRLFFFFATFVFVGVALKYFGFWAWSLSPAQRLRKRETQRKQGARGIILFPSPPIYLLLSLALKPAPPWKIPGNLCGGERAWSRVKVICIDGRVVSTWDSESVGPAVRFPMDAYRNFFNFFSFFFFLKQ